VPANVEVPDDEVIYHLLDRVLELSNQTKAAVGDALRALELTESLANLLWRVEAVAPPSMSELAALLSCDPSTVTFIVTKLEQRGLVERLPSPDDGRAKVVALTPDGRHVRAQLVEAMAVRSPLGRLSPPEQRQLHGLITRATQAHPGA